ncbi:MAG: hemolysin family protein [Fuerstiella sp.]|nr:hemolysin family protein [Fuerstiella sp.]
MLEPVAAATAVLLTFLMALTCFSLRDFSRSRLEEICKQRGRLSRFGEILQNHEAALFLSELTLLTLLLIGTWLIAVTPLLGSLEFPRNGALSTIISWFVKVAAILAAASLTLVALPWTVSRVHGETVLYRLWPPLKLACRILAPLWHTARQLDRMVHRIVGIPEPDSDAAANLLTDELLTVVDESCREGVMQSNASTMIHRVVDLQTEDVAAIMTPRTDMVTIDAEMPLSESLKQMLNNGFSRVPVIRDGIDDIVGILYARDLLAYAVESNRESDSRTVADVAREALYAPESQGIGDLLEAMRQKKVHMAVIVDEYSGVSGLVTLEDVLEEIVGDISDEYDSEDSTLWKEHVDGRTEVDARFHMDDLNEEFGYGFPEDEEFDTIGGFVLSCFGRIPAIGEEHYWKDLKLTVLDADERHLIRVSIEGPTVAGSTAKAS